MQFIARLEPMEALNSVNVSVVCRKQELRRQKDDGRLKSTNSSSELNNKGCPLIYIKDQTIPLCLYGSSSTAEQAGEPGPGGTLNVEVICMLVVHFVENPKKYPDFDFKPLKNTQIAILRAVWGKIASIFQKFSRRP